MYAPGLGAIPALPHNTHTTSCISNWPFCLSLINASKPHSTHLAFIIMLAWKQVRAEATAAAMKEVEAQKKEVEHRRGEVRAAQDRATQAQQEASKQANLLAVQSADLDQRSARVAKLEVRHPVLRRLLEKSHSYTAGHALLHVMMSNLLSLLASASAWLMLPWLISHCRNLHDNQSFTM